MREQSKWYKIKWYTIGALGSPMISPLIGGGIGYLIHGDTGYVVAWAIGIMLLFWGLYMQAMVKLCGAKYVAESMKNADLIN